MFGGSNSNQIGPGLGILIFGGFLTAIGGFAYGACSATSVSPGLPAPDCGGFGWVVGVGILLLLVGIILVVVKMRSSVDSSDSFEGDPAVPPPLVTPVVIEQTVVKVRCRYCGEMVDPTAGRCPGCGAPL